MKLPAQDLCDLLDVTMGYLFGGEFSFHPSKANPDLFETEIMTCKIVISRKECLDNRADDRVKMLKEKYNEAVKVCAEKALVLRNQLANKTQTERK